jgi:hypothetical protein
MPKIPEVGLEWRKRLRDAERLLRKADSMSRTLWRLRGGSPLETALGCCSPRQSW